MFSSMKSPRLSQPLTSPHVQNRRGEENNRHKNKNHVPHLNLLGPLDLDSKCPSV